MLVFSLSIIINFIFLAKVRDFQHNFKLHGLPCKTKNKIIDKHLYNC